MHLEDISQRVLILDDDEDDILILKAVLAQCDLPELEIQTESNPEAAIKLLLEEEFPICFMDYRLGSITGLDVLERIKSQTPFTQYVMLTGKGDQAIAIRSMKAGAADYLEKGLIDRSQMERTVRHLLEASSQTRRLHANRLAYEALFHKTSDAIFVANHKMEVIKANALFERMFSNGKELGDLFNLILIEEDKDKLAASLQSGKLPNNRKVLFRTRDGEEKTCLLSLVELEQARGPSKFIGLINDISTFMEAEQQVRIAEKLALTGTMSRVIGHEVRNPLTNIKLCQENLRQNCTDPDLDVYFEITDRNVARIETLIDDLLQSARPDASKKEPLHLEEIIRSAIDRCKDRIMMSEVQLETEIEEDLPLLEGSPSGLELAVTNLIINAIQAMSETEQKRLHIQLHPSGDFLVLRVRDTGIGMDAQTQARIFDPYFSLKSKGSGLGLTASRNLFDAHGCQINIFSRLGKGTLFTIRFPISSQA